MVGHWRVFHGQCAFDFTQCVLNWQSHAIEVGIVRRRYRLMCTGLSVLGSFSDTVPMTVEAALNLPAGCSGFAIF